MTSIDYIEGSNIKRKPGFWFFLHLGVVLAGVFVIPGALGWVLAAFSSICALLIYKFPSNKIPVFAEYADTASGGKVPETGAGMFQDMDDSICDAGYVGIKYYGD